MINNVIYNIVPQILIARCITVFRKTNILTMWAVPAIAMYAFISQNKKTLYNIHFLRVFLSLCLSLCVCVTSPLFQIIAPVCTCPNIYGTESQALKIDVTHAEHRYLCIVKRLFVLVASLVILVRVFLFAVHSRAPANMIS